MTDGTLCGCLSFPHVGERDIREGMRPGQPRVPKRGSHGGRGTVVGQALVAKGPPREVERPTRLVTGTQDPETLSPRYCGLGLGAARVSSAAGAKGGSETGSSKNTAAATRRVPCSLAPGAHRESHVWVSAGLRTQDTEGRLPHLTPARGQSKASQTWACRYAGRGRCLGRPGGGLYLSAPPCVTPLGLSSNTTVSRRVGMWERQGGPSVTEAPRCPSGTGLMVFECQEAQAAPRVAALALGKVR